jgi:hypothetical protein
MLEVPSSTMKLAFVNVTVSELTVSLAISVVLSFPYTITSFTPLAKVLDPDSNN